MKVIFPIKFIYRKIIDKMIQYKYVEISNELRKKNIKKGNV